jgi:transcriptional regulator with XRE-family HTH domain
MRYRARVSAATYLNQARRAAGFSQRELSRRTGVPQSAIARIEQGKQVPRADTLDRLLRACGFELRLGPTRGGGVDTSLVDHWLELSPAERAEGAADYGRALDRLQAARPVAS